MLDLALYAFDGTNNLPKDNTNVWLTAKGGGYKYKNKVKYLKGVGNEDEYHGLNRYILALGLGIGMKAKSTTMLEALKGFINKGDTEVDIIGFSRGAVTVIMFANAIKKAKDGKDPIICKVKKIRFMGLYDPVPGPGWSKPTINSRFVSKTSIAYSLDETRKLFLPFVYSGGGITTMAFRGVHSDIGGGYKRRGLTNITLEWMINQGGNTFKMPTSVAGSSQMVRHFESGWVLYGARTGLGGIPRHPSVSQLLEDKYDKGTKGGIAYFWKNSGMILNYNYNIGDKRF